MTNLNWAEPSEEPTLISELFLFAEAFYQQGRAIERCDLEVARNAQRVGLATLGSILRMVDPDGRSALTPPLPNIPLEAQALGAITAPDTNSTP